MSIARAMTRRMRRNDSDDLPATPPVPPVPGRSKTVVDRFHISGPIALVSTTNMLSYNAPDLATFRKQPSTTILSATDAEDSDHSTSNRSRASSHASRDTFTDASSVSSSSPTSPGPNHLSSYHNSTHKHIRKSASSGNLHQLKETIEESEVEPVPALPERALSHSKRAHERLAHKRSLQTVSRCSSTRSSREQRASTDMFTATIHEEAAHPFGAELEQLSEVAEEFGDVVRDAAMKSNLAIMRDRHLASFSVADYMAEIEPLFALRFDMNQSVAWI